MIEICHVTNVHSSDDARIFHKECCSLAKAGYDVTLVAPGESREEDGVHVIGCGKKPVSRIKRATQFGSKVINKALEQNCDIYHLHDPELLMYVSRIKKKGKKVIFDSHEDYFFEKEYLPKPIRKAVSDGYLAYEKRVMSKIDGLICCYRKTRERLEPVSKHCEMIYNFPILLNEIRHNVSEAFTIGYAGGIGTIWNHDKLVAAISDIPSVKYVLAGRCNDKYLKDLQKLKGWEKVDYLGMIPFDQVIHQIYAKASLGVALLGYIPECNGKEGNLSNTKLFEIMHAGLPVLATDFDLWKEIVEKNKCGICVNPYDAEEIRRAIQYLQEHSDERIQMGINARRAVEKTYNWGNEEAKLLNFYKSVLNFVD